MMKVEEAKVEPSNNTALDDLQKKKATLQKEKDSALDAYCKACVVRYTTTLTEKADYLAQLTSTDPLSSFSCKHDYLAKVSTVISY